MIRVGIVGLGMAVAPHAQSLIDLRGRVEVAYAFSPSEARRAAFAARFPFPTTERLDTMLADESVRAVLVLTPPNTHLDIVRRCAAAGKHVLLEKPLEVTTRRSEELVAVCRAAGLVLGVVLQHRFRPAALQLTGLLGEGLLGPLAGCSAAVRLWRPQSYYDEPGRGTKARDGGGVLLTQAIHTLDLLLSFAGEAREVCGYAMTSVVHRMESEDLVCAAVRFASGAIGTVEATTAAFPGHPERIDLIARDGSAMLAGTQLTVRWHDGRELAESSDGAPGGTGADPMAFPHAYHRALIADFLDAIEQGREPRASGGAALRVHRFIDALLAAGASETKVRVQAGTSRARSCGE